MSMPYRDLLSAALLALLGIAVQIYARGIEPRFKTGADSGMLPEIVSAAMILIAAIIAITAFRCLRRTAASDDNPDITVDASSPQRVWGSFGLIVAYVALTPVAGFLIATVGFLFAQLTLLAPAGERRPLAYAVTAVIAAIAIHTIFIRGFGLPLPRGLF